MNIICSPRNLNGFAIKKGKEKKVVTKKFKDSGEDADETVEESKTIDLLLITPTTHTF